MQTTLESIITVGSEAIDGNVVSLPHGLSDTPTDIAYVQARSFDAMGVDGVGNPGGAFFVLGANATHIQLGYASGVAGGENNLSYKCKRSIGNPE